MKGKDPDAIVRSVRCFGEMHEKLCDTIIDFNFCYALQILLMMASAFGYTLFSIFGIIHTFSLTKYDNNASMNNLVYGIIYLSFIIQVAVIGSLVTHEQLRSISPSVSCLLFDFEWPFLVSVRAYAVPDMKVDR
uniref:Uncharacterized protein n=1 Tax=Anopheles farauti TaxID=69004 RepID=A0A182Q785_9DIPT